MSKQIYIKETEIAATVEKVFAFHELPDAFERLIPPWEDAEIIEKADISVIGSRAVIQQKIFGLIPQTWVAEHTAYDPPHLFEDVQISGPFKSWVHRHIIEPKGEHAVLRDEITFDPGFSFLGSLMSPVLIRPKIEKMFEYRHMVTKTWCEDS